jgi:hypothetical protein
MRTHLNVWLALVSTVVAGYVGTGDVDAGGNRLWTTMQAESISVVRGMPVRVHYCRGLDGADRRRAEPRFTRFRCLAGARASSDPYGVETIAVLYVLHPLAPYHGPGSKHRLTNVRFIGGPGIP